MKTTFADLPTRLIFHEFPMWIKALFRWRMDSFT